MNKKLLIGIIIAVLIAIGIGVTVYLTQQQQDVRQRAEEPQNPFGKALRFNGSDGYFLKTEAMEYRGPLTLEGWIKPQATESGATIFSINIDGQNPACGDAVLVNITPVITENIAEYHVTADIDQGNSQQTVLSNPSFTALYEEWSHVALVIEASDSAHLFLNGTEIAEQTLPKEFCADTTINIGSFYRGGSSNNILNPYLGEVDEIRISSIAHYIEDFSLPTTPFTPDGTTISLWHVDGTAVDEFTGNEAAISSSVIYVDSTLGGPVAPPACQADLATCEWDPSDGSTSYSVKIVDGDSNTIKEEVVEASITSLSFTSQPNRTYTCTVTPINACGEGTLGQATATCAVSPTPTPTGTPVPTPTGTPVPTNTPTPIPTSTPIPTPTPTTPPPPPSQPTNTPVPPPPNAPVPTNTPVPPNQVVAGPTNTPTPTIEAPGSALQTLTIAAGLILTIIGAIVLFVL